MPQDATATDNVARAPGRTTGRPTRRRVLIADRIADWGIRIGGLGVIAAVFGIMIFLASVVLPLFAGGSIVAERPVAAIVETAARPLFTDLDEHRSIAFSLEAAGKLRVVHLEAGRVLETKPFDWGDADVRSYARTIEGGHFALGFADGTVRFGTLRPQATVVLKPDMPANLEALKGGDLTDGKAIYSPLDTGRFRRLELEAKIEQAAKIAPEGVAIVAINYIVGGTKERPTLAFVTLDAAGQIRMSHSETRLNMLTGATSTRTRSVDFPALPAGFTVRHMLIGAAGADVFLADRTGTVLRYDTRGPRTPELVERTRVLNGDTELTVFGFLNGQQAIVAGGSDGSVRIHFVVSRPEAQTADRQTLVAARELDRHAAPVVALAASQRSKSFVTLDSAGNAILHHGTSEQTLLRFPADPQGAPPAGLALGPRDDAVLALRADGSARVWTIDAPHPEISFRAVFGTLWYEGYDKPSFTWQSSAATDSFEPKLSLVPLIFGTLKATFYSLLFAVPLALLAAIFSSQFLAPQARSVLKPTMELMASVPSVVLGFIAALVLAPLVESWLTSVLLTFLAMPAGLFLAAYLWQFLPGEWAIRLDGAPRFAAMALALLLGIVLGFGGAPVFEAFVFAGDIKAWLNRDIGTSRPILFLLLFPLCYLVAAAGFRATSTGRSRDFRRRLPEFQAASLHMVEWVALLSAAALLSATIAWILHAVGADLRDAFLGTYTQRNTFIVGFAMGFAVIPIIFTIAEDALSAVPEHLRSASLACGATPWQTAIRIVLPTALSGVFAAVMIGMGRAVGETMIVVMAAGNTPILDLNPFNGLRALSANIAVELPEAVQGSTLYRVLFLAALTLFVMAFAINTLAELIRLRFRKRATQL
jgi:phosphate transport system permease protein